MDRYPQRFLQQLAPLVKVHIDEGVSSNYSTSIKVVLDRVNADKRYHGHDGLIIDYIPDLTQVGLESSAKSPSNPESDLYPNGILSQSWFQKYTDHVAMAVIIVMQFTVDHDEISWADAILGLKNQAAATDSKLVLIICGGEDGEAEDLRRIRDLQYLTHLTPESIHFIPFPKAVPKQLKEVIACMPQWAQSFYGAILSRVQYRRKNYDVSTNGVDTSVVMTQKFWETRNVLKEGFLSEFFMSPKWSNAIRQLENGYNMLVEIVASSFAGKLAENYPLSAHDARIYVQFRQLLDIVAFHIFRGYMQISNPETALKKHAVHIKIGNDICMSQYGDYVDESVAECRYWNASQYELIADYVKIHPLEKLRGDTNLAPFYGGFSYTLDATTKMEIYSDPSRLYLHAFNRVAPVSDGKRREFDYMIGNDSHISEYKISLLQKAIAQAADVSLKSYLYYLLSVNVESNGQANEYLSKSAATMDKSTELSGLMHQLLVLGNLLEVEKPQGNSFTDLILSAGIGAPGSCPDLRVNATALSSTISPLDLVKVETVMVNESLAQSTYVYDSCVIQIKLSPAVNIANLKQITRGGDVSLVVNHLDLGYTDGDIEIKHDPQESQLTPKLLTKGTAYLDLTSGTPVILWYKFIPNKVGVINLKQLDIHATLKIGDAEAISNQHSITPIYYRSFVTIHTPDGPQSVRGHDGGFHQLNIKPLRPNIEVSIEDTQLIVGETAKIPVLISFQHPKTHKLNESIGLLPRVSVSGEAEFLTRVYWENNKDDEPLDLSDLVVNPNPSKKTHNLFISVEPLPGYFADEELLATVNVTSIVTGKTTPQADEVSLFTIPMKSRFYRDLRFSVIPRFSDDDKEYMPSPFIVGDDKAHLGLPLVTRLWQARMVVDTIEDVEVVGISYEIRQLNNEISLLLLGEPTGLTQDFTTQSKSGFSHRSVAVVVSAKLAWKRKDSPVVNDYQTRDFEVSLPMSDPRVLLRLNRHGKQVHMYYVLENPTPRVFTFTTTMENTQGWNFDDTRNIVPLKQPPFPIMPFSRYKMDWYIEGEGPLPELRSYDVNYKVQLTTLIVE